MWKRPILFWICGALAAFSAQPAFASGEAVSSPISATSSQNEHSVGAIAPLHLSIGNVDRGSNPTNAPVLGEREAPATTVDEWAAQIAQNLVQITGVEVTPAGDGIIVLLQTSGGTLPEPATRTLGNALIVEIPNASLVLQGDDDYFAANPVEGIALVSVSALGGDGVQVTITGADGPPEAAIASSSTGLSLSVVPATIPLAAPEVEDEALRVTVTGEQETGYAVDQATTATRTDTPLRDIPQSIQVVPEQVIEDQRAVRLNDALRNVSGVVQGNTFGNTGDTFVLRGFTASDNFLRNGFRLPSSDLAFLETANLERVEVLKGPASVLYGNLEPGGVINIVTKQPLPEPFYELGLQVGSYGLVRPTVDVSGPITADRSLLYRLNAVYERADGFRDYDTQIQRAYVAPTLAWAISDNTDLTVDLEYLYDERPFDRGLVNDANFEIPDVPFSRIFGEPDDVSETSTLSTGYSLEHRFNDDWTLRNAFRYLSSDAFNYRAEPLYDTDEDGNLSRNFRSNDNRSETFALQTNVVGDFATGPVEHTLLFGVDWFRDTRTGGQRRFPGVTSLNIFDPVYEVTPRPPLSELTRNFFTRVTRNDNIGIYAQDQIAFTDNLKLLVGGRFDIVDQFSDEIWLDTIVTQNDTAFSPRIGLVYQPIEPVSLYASYSRSFQPNDFTDANGEFLPPERGTQYEVGVRGEFLEGRLVANLALFDLTKTNLATADPNNLDFSVATGRARSQGIELDVIGEILPGWNVIASYAYTNARITEDNDPERIGLRLQDSAYNTASLWTSYEFQEGDLQGLGFGAGMFYVGDRIDGFIPSVTLGNYLRVDAALYYQRQNWRAALNFQNLFDERYIQSGFYNPGEPFTVIGSVSVEF
ncbi:TonB-dependent siderophore receptor [filamentous cyanobacterium CCT1]|nr:TonB-dependent siderophore receptor [filamentous cyanobacterium CCT1]PSN76755.1 TonB-dependent siderophore receptor [filamentous cyanobacterium CCP4]